MTAIQLDMFATPEEPTPEPGAAVERQIIDVA